MKNDNLINGPINGPQAGWAPDYKSEKTDIDKAKLVLGQYSQSYLTPNDIDKLAERNKQIAELQQENARLQADAESTNRLLNIAESSINILKNEVKIEQQENARLQAELEAAKKEQLNSDKEWADSYAKLYREKWIVELALNDAREALVECVKRGKEMYSLCLKYKLFDNHPLVDFPRSLELDKENDILWGFGKYLDEALSKQQPETGRVGAVVQAAKAWFKNCKKKWELPPTAWRNFPMRGVTQYREDPEKSTEYDLYVAVEALQALEGWVE